MGAARLPRFFVAWRFDHPSNCIYSWLLEFLFDRSKDRINRNKHGIGLSRAADFDFDAAIFGVDDRNDYGEVRIKAIGFLDARLYALVFTQEGENIRAISLRKASKDEESNYEDGN